MQETLDQISPILPIHFFGVSLDLYEAEKKDLQKRHLLPDFSDLLIQDRFAKVSMGWQKKGLIFHIQVEQAFQDSFFPDYRKGDSIELFLDTRDLKSAGFLTRFCHHFVILPKKIDGIHAEEVTHFRSDDRHELCVGENIGVTTDFARNKYIVKIFVPSDCLYGYDPGTFDKLGFTYRINRFGGKPQGFSISSESLAIEKEPALFSSMQMRKK